MAARRARVSISGAVQGVGFRVETQRRARSLGVAGFVRNLSDGTVEAAFEGKDERVESMLEWCRRGPSGAWVAAVDVESEEPQGDVGFSVD